MSTWLDPVRRFVAAQVSPITFFFRDDDAGWEDDKLFRLLDVFAYCEVPVALAAIPIAVGSRLACELRALVTAKAPLVSVHQHGFAHANHEPTGRKCEFGRSRPPRLQRQDLADGKERLQQALGCALPPMFTPPWNRCTRDTAECLAELGFEVLSRDVSSAPFDLVSLHELAVSLDWSGRHGARTGPDRWGETIAHAIALGGGPIGFMLHHAVMTADDRRMLSDLLRVLMDRPNVAVRPMLDIATASHTSGGNSPCAS